MATIFGYLRRKKRERYIQSLVRNGMTLGKNVRFADVCFLDSAHCYLISIGDDTVLAPNVTILTHDASTRWFLGYTKLGPVSIGKNCFIGASSIILPGVTIGDRSIVGSGSVVTKNVEEETVVAGNPAVPIMKTADYLTKIQSDAESPGNRIFGSEYHLWNLNKERREELVEHSNKGTAYIV